MSLDRASMSRAPAGQEVYTVGYSDRMRCLMGQRTASSSAGFLLSHLRKGMVLLDCGCGPGSITLDLAEIVAPGYVLGIDRECSQIEAARALALRRGILNASFKVGNVYDLEFPEPFFDVVFSHALLVYLREPQKALNEMRRVLRPGGFVGLVDPDFGARVWSPSSPLFDQFQSLFLRVLEYNGASPYYARHQRQLLLEAGFVRTEAHTISLSCGNLEKTRTSAASWEHCGRSSAFREVALGLGWTDTATLDAMCDELRVWAERPDAFNALLSCAAIGWLSD